MRKIFHPDAKPRCGTCGLHLELCECALLEPIAVALDLTFLQHRDELGKSTNTVRIARHLCPDLGLVPWEGRGADCALAPATLLLFPAEGVPVLGPDEVRQRPLAILDGTWAQASRMFRVLEGKGFQARRLPEELIHTWQARRSGRPERMSSAHAASLLLGLNGETHAAQALSRLVERVGEGFQQMRGLGQREKSGRQDSAIKNP
jgi:DTW domain-containing protein YfiP